jgi:hypothetical protein
MVYWHLVAVAAALIIHNIIHPHRLWWTLDTTTTNDIDIPSSKSESESEREFEYHDLVMLDSAANLESNINANDDMLLHHAQQME